MGSTSDALLVANTGRPFTREGVISICASHLTEKGSDPPEDIPGVEDHELIDAICAREIATYKTNPNRLKEDRHGEEEISKNYGGRFIWELLQNADDARAPVSTSAAELIGTKGLGFKSVLEITDEPEIHSPPFHFQFSPSKSQRLLAKENISRNPPRLTFRIPHSVRPNDLVQGLLDDGYTTVIRLPFRDDVSREIVVGELEQLGPEFLLFSQHLKRVEVTGGDANNVMEIRSEKGKLKSGDVKLTWRVDGRRKVQPWRRWVQIWKPAPDAEKRLSIVLCLPLDKSGLPRPTPDKSPFYMFFKTNEEPGVRALIHASFEVETNRKHVRYGKFDPEIISTFRTLFSSVVNEIPPETVLSAFGEVEEKEAEEPIDLLMSEIRRVLRDTSFVPTLGGGLSKPGEVMFWHDALGTVLDEEKEDVRSASLLDPTIAEYRDLLSEKFDAKPLPEDRYGALLKLCKNNTLQECEGSLRVLVRAGLSRVPSSYPSDWRRNSAMLRLRRVPCFFTSEGVARSLEGDQPLLQKRPRSWPDWISADDLHPSMREVVDSITGGKDTGPSTETKPEPPRNWRELLNGYLLASRSDFLNYGLLPTLARWNDERWSRDGWKAIKVFGEWCERKHFEHVQPLAHGDESDSARVRLSDILRLPTKSGWLSAKECYAGKAWDGLSSFDSFFQDINNRGVVRPFSRWSKPARLEKEKDEWKGLLRFAGVSWEPKMVKLLGWDSNLPFWEEYMEIHLSTFNRIEEDWRFEHFPDCCHGETNRSAVIRACRILLEQTQKHPALYLSKHAQKATSLREPHNFAEYQLRTYRWVPHKPCYLADNANFASPKDVYLPGSGLRGTLPEVDLTGFSDLELLEVQAFLVTLGVRNKLPDDPESWWDWFGKLQDKAENSHQGEVIRQSIILYRTFLRRVDTASPINVKVPCWEYQNGQKVFGFCHPRRALWVDEPYLEDEKIKVELLGIGRKLFILMLQEGATAPEKLGVKPLSSVLEHHAEYGSEQSAISADVNKRYMERLSILRAAVGQNATRLPDVLKMKAVSNLRLALKLSEDEELGAVPVKAFHDGTDLLIEADGDSIRCLGIGLSNYVIKQPRLKSLLENLLKAKDQSEAIDRLRDEGIPPEVLDRLELDWEQPPASEEVSPVVKAMTTDDDVSEHESEQVRPDQPITDTKTDDESNVPQPVKETTNTDNTLESDIENDLGEFDDLTFEGQFEIVLDPDENPDETQTRPPNDPAIARERGKEAEDWLYKALKESLQGWKIDRRVRDKKLRESDFVISRDELSYHIEVKSVGSDRILWTRLEYEKAADNPDQFFMALLFSANDGDFKIYWLWNPVEELTNEDRRIRWIWNTHQQGINLVSGLWDVSGFDRPQREPNKFSYEISISKNLLSNCVSDDTNLSALVTQIEGGGQRTS